MENNTITLPKLDTEITLSKDWLAERDQLILQAAEVIVDDNDTYNMAGEILSRITKTSNAMESFRKDYSKPYLDAQRLIKHGADDARESLEDAKKRLQTDMSKYQAEQRRKADAERKRIEEENRAAIERQVAESEELGLEPEIVEPVVKVPQVAVPKSNAVRVQQTIGWEIIDEDAVNAALKVVDTRKVNAYKSMYKDAITKKCKAGHGEYTLNGIKWVLTDKIIAR